MPHTQIENLILGGPKNLKITVMQDTTIAILPSKPSESQVSQNMVEIAHFYAYCRRIYQKSCQPCYAQPI